MSYEVTIGLIGLAFMFVVFLSGIELAFGMAALGFVGFGFLVNFNVASNLLVKDFFDTFTTYSFTVIPLFVLMGQIASNSSLAKRLYHGAHAYVGHIPGGLAMTTVVGATLFKAMCGSTLATAATFSGLAIPEMNRYKYSKTLSAGVVASVGTLGLLIPPSLTLIIFGIITEQSIGRLFLAGIFPGLIISALFMVVIFGWATINPKIAPAAKKATWKERIRALPELLWVAMVFGLVIGGMMMGIFSPTEAGTMGTVGVLILVAVRRDVSFKMLVKSFDESLRTACMVLLLIYGSQVLGHFLAITEIPFVTADWVAGLQLPRELIVVIVMFIYLIGGSFMDDLAFMILATPILYPAIMKLGYDPIWFGILVAVTLMIGVIIPPIAISVFIVKNITGLPFGTIYKGVVPFLLSFVICGALLFLFPQIALFLPNLFMGR